MAISINGTTGVITGVSEGGLPDGSVNTADIKDLSITGDKLGTGSVSTDKIDSGAVTSAKLDSGVTSSIDAKAPLSQPEFTGDYVKVPVGSTATRPSGASAGYIRFNTTEGTLEQYDGSAWSQMNKPPIISSLSYPGSQTAVSPDGGDVITISGSNFQTGINVFFRSSTYASTYATSVTRTNSTSLSVTTPALTAGDYDVIVEQADGTQAILTSGLTSNAAPVFTTASGSLGSIQNDQEITTITLVATETDGGVITYNVTTGALPTGLSLSGADIDGTPTGYTAETTANFTITATDDENQTTTRNFSLTVLVKFYSYTIEQSLRWNDDDSAELSWTPSSAGNRNTWTWSGWVKRGNIDIQQCLFQGHNSGASGGANENRSGIHFDSSNRLYFQVKQTGTDDYVQVRSTPIYRDVSAWYHIVVILDTSQGTSAPDGRIKMYVNGNQITSFDNYSVSNLTSNVSYINNADEHTIGWRQAGGEYFDGYLAEVNFIDGQALDPTSFGEAKEGVWVPKSYSGTYGTNGFYLPFKQDYQVEGMSAVTWTGTSDSNGDGKAQYIGGVGFQPDLVWIKGRNQARDHVLHDTVRGLNKGLHSNRTVAEYTNADVVEGVSADGFIAGDFDNANRTNWTYVAWCWDMGGSNTTNTNGSITSTVRANPTYGQSIVSYTGTGSTGTVGHGLSSTPEFVIIKKRDSADNWIVQRQISNILTLHTTNAEGSAPNFIQSWNSTTFQLGDSSNTPDTSVGASGGTYIAYCFHSVSGYSKIGSYTGSHSTAKTITTGFKPAFVVCKMASNADHWWMFDNVRTDKTLRVNSSNAEINQDQFVDITFNSDGFTVEGSELNSSGEDFIYMAFADTREFAYWLDQSGNNNDWTSNNLTESDVVLDSPTNNFCTLDPLQRVDSDSSIQFLEGNLKVNNTNASLWAGTYSTFGVSSGKWYWEGVVVEGDSTSDMFFGIQQFDGATPIDWDAVSPQDFGGAIFYYGDSGNKKINGSYSAYGSSYGVGDVLGVALDMDSATPNVTFYKNNVSQGALNLSLSTYTGKTVTPAIAHYIDAITVNFGQDSSFAGNKTAQGNTDGNGIGDFYYTPPTGYLALCNENLPDDDTFELNTGEKPSDHFNTVLYTGNGSTQSITSVSFQPDFVWIKRRDGGDYHRLIDSVRGVTKGLYSNTDDAENTTSAGAGLDSFDSDGFTLLGGSVPYGAVNANNESYVAWCWKAGGTPVSNTDGSITSSVSANQDSGFSIVTYTGTGSNLTVGHGLGIAPKMIIVKARNDTKDWTVYHIGMGNNKDMLLNLTNAENTSVAWNNTTPTSTVFSIGTLSNVNVSGKNYVAYCFAEVDGFSKIGSYAGNGSTDGTFVYTGFRPAYVMIKRSSHIGDWWIKDSKRDTDNPTETSLLANSTAIDSDTRALDLLSNGFKQRTSDSYVNGSGATYIYMAFAEDPFKYGNAR